MCARQGHQAAWQGQIKVSRLTLADSSSNLVKSARPSLTPA